jgi:predicted O-methyltransferase YrrM
MNAYKMNNVESKLRVLHNDAKKDFARMSKGIVKSIFRPMQPSDFENVYLPISKEQGETIRELIIKNNSKQVVEFGTSFGISTIYLADAVRQTGGKVVTTELLETKANRASQNINDADLGEYVEVRIGDAMQTLKNDSSPIDFLFLDGWKDLYLPLFQMLAPRFHANTLIYADNMDMSETKDYADYLKKNRSKYSSQMIDDGKAWLTRVV